MNKYGTTEGCPACSAINKRCKDREDPIYCYMQVAAWNGRLQFVYVDGTVLCEIPLLLAHGDAAAATTL